MASNTLISDARAESSLPLVGELEGPVSERSVEGAGQQMGLIVGGGAAAAGALHALLVGLRVLQARGTMECDPAHHTLWGVTIYEDLLQGQLLTALFDTYRQVYWPFLHSWMLAVAMALLGPEIEAARVVSLVCWELTALALAVLVWRATQSRIAAIAAPGLWLTSSAAFFRVGTEAFTEAPAIAMTCVAFLVIDRACVTGTWSLAGLGALAVFFTKTDYGILVAFAALATMAHAAPDRPALMRGLRLFLAPVAVIGVVWFAYPPKLHSTILALQNRPMGPPRFSIEGILFHPRMLATWCDGWLVAGLGIVCLVLTAVRAARSPRTAHRMEIALASYTGLALLLHELSQTKDEKHIVKIVPWLFVLMALRMADLRRTVPVRLLLLALGVLLMVRGSVVTGLPARDGRYGSEEAIGAILARVDAGRRHLVVGAFKELSHYELMADVLRQDGATQITPDPLTLGEHSKEWWYGFVDQLRHRVPLISAIEPPVHESRRVHLDAVPAKRSDSEPSDPESIRARLFPDRDPDRVFVVLLDRGSRWSTADYRRYIVPGDPFVPYLRARGFATTETLRYDDPGITVVVMDRGHGPAAS